MDIKMKALNIVLTVIILILLGFGITLAIVSNNNSEEIDTRIDNMGYWERAAKKGLVPYNPDVKVKNAVFTGSTIRATTVATLDSPDVPVTDINSVQSENSVFINPIDETNVLNSNNSAENNAGTPFGADYFFSFDTGTTWDGSIEGAGGNNSGDPAAVIGLNGRWYVNYINYNQGMGVAYSDDQGQSWTYVDALSNPDIETDKNHMWIDNSPDSPYEGNVYIAWTNFAELNQGEIGICYSTDDGETWTYNSNISSAVSAGSHNQGVNLSTGPNGELYAVWAIYDTWLSGGSDEVAIGMSTSFDGGVTWDPARRIISNIRGIRASKTSKNMRVNSFPSAVVDNSNSADRGAIYVTWSNIGTPGINTGDDIDVYVIKSTDHGNTWTTPLKVNQDEPGQGKEHFFPWITCDPTHGILSMIYYDDRNVGPEQCEVFCANSVDGGETWEEFKVSDVGFTPAPIPGMAVDYMGDYLGIHAKNGVVYPVWTDNRLGHAMSFCSPYQTNPINRPFDIEGNVVFETGEANLYWSYEYADGFDRFVIYREGDSIASTTDTSFTQLLPEYGVFKYRVTASYAGGVESGATGIELQWGTVDIDINPDEISDYVAIGEESDHFLKIKNNGQLDLEYSIELNSVIAEGIPVKDRQREYCEASGGSGLDHEYISGVETGDISNLNTGNDNYADYSDQSTAMQVGTNYEITVTNGKPYDMDQCAVWVDWNINGVFDDDEITVLTGINGTEIFKGLLSPTPGSSTGLTKMRVRLTYTGALNPCGGTNFGEVEDYSVFVKGWMDMDPLSGSLPPGDSGMVSVKFNTTDLPVDLYFTNALIHSNDPNDPVIIIPISLRTDSIVVSASSNPEIACKGSIVVLSANVSGEFDSITYVWSSNPEGFVSTKARTFAIASEPTWYISEIWDGTKYSKDSVFVDVIPSPVVDIGSDTSLCGDISWTLDAKNPGSEYFWSTGETTQTIMIDTTGKGLGNQTINVDVTNSFGCVTSDQIAINFVNCTGIDEKEVSRITISPNPNNGEFIIKTGITDYKKCQLRIFSSTGNKVYNNSNSEIGANGEIIVWLEDQDPGYYTAILIVDSRILTTKFILVK